MNRMNRIFQTFPLQLKFFSLRSNNIMDKLPPHSSDDNGHIGAEAPCTHKTRHDSLRPPINGGGVALWMLGAGQVWED